MAFSNRPNRKTTRLPEYDYAQPGAYFVTIVTKDRKCVLGEVSGDEMILSSVGKIVRQVWKQIPQHFSNVELDAFIVMPNHVHNIIWILEDQETNVRAQHAAPLPDAKGYKGPFSGSLGAIVRSFKAEATKQVNQFHNTPGEPLWHRNYFDRVIRTENELNETRLYIQSNPSLWAEDEENPNLQPSR